MLTIKFPLILLTKKQTSHLWTKLFFHSIEHLYTSLKDVLLTTQDFKPIYSFSLFLSQTQEYMDIFTGFKLPTYNNVATISSWDIRSQAELILIQSPWPWASVSLFPSDSSACQPTYLIYSDWKFVLNLRKLSKKFGKSCKTNKLPFCCTLFLSSLGLSMPYLNIFSEAECPQHISSPNPFICERQKL